MEAPAQDIPYTTAHGGAYFNNAGAAVVDPQSVQAAHAAAQEAVGRARAQAAAVQQQQQLAVARSASCGSLANTGMSRNDSAADLLSVPQQLVAPAMPGVGSAAPTQTPMLVSLAQSSAPTTRRRRRTLALSSNRPRYLEASTQTPLMAEMEW